MPRIFPVISSFGVTEPNTGTFDASGAAATVAPAIEKEELVIHLFLRVIVPDAFDLERFERANIGIMCRVLFRGRDEMS